MEFGCLMVKSNCLISIVKQEPYISFVGTNKKLCDEIIIRDLDRSFILLSVNVDGVGADFRVSKARLFKFLRCKL